MAIRRRAGIPAAHSGILERISVTGLIPLSVLLGAVIGSFLNVVVARLPRGESIAYPGSHCPICRAPIAWFDNIPLLSFVTLRGQCRRCRAPISWRYPLVEAATAALFGLAAWRFGLTVELAAAWLLLAALVAITVIDLDHQIIPDTITLPGVAVGFLMSLVNPSLRWRDSLLGIAVGGGLILIVILASRGGMGGGDMKLCAMIGAFLGWPLLVLTLFIAVIAGGIIAATLLMTGLRKRKDRIPFGPFLAASAVISVFWGDALIDWYVSGFAG